ncbi:MAG: hypothetical protein J6L62_07540 [Clostridia bacterium]|nr:hypothetical protein [Clostridia bacterium]
MENLNDIIASLSPEDINALKEAASTLFSNGADFQFQDETSSSRNKNSKQTENFFNFDNTSMFNADMFSNIGKIMSMMSSDGGRRCRLIEALKPNLSRERQHKADEAMQIIKLLEILPMISELSKRGD